MKNYADFSKRARQISESKQCCIECYYGGPSHHGCYCPFSDAFMEDKKMNPCYDGALIMLVHKATVETAEKMLFTFTG